jgi:hypothetical protein
MQNIESGWLTVEKEHNSIDALLKHLKDYIDTLEWRYNHLKEELNKLNDEKWKDTALQEMRQKLDEAYHDLNRGFGISKENNEKITKWQDVHDANVHHNYNHYHGACGGGYEYSFHPTAIGVTAACICSNCKAKAIEEKGLKWYQYCKDELHGLIEFGDFG